MKLTEMFDVQQFVNKSNELNSTIKDQEYEQMKTRMYNECMDIWKVNEPFYESEIERIILYALSKNIHFMFDSTEKEKRIHLF